MRIDLNIRGLKRSEKIRRAVDRRLRFALGRFSSKLRSVRTDVGDLNGPRGGVDKYCHIAVRTERGQELRVRAVEDSLERALDRAADRISRVVARHLALARSFDRRSVVEL